MGTESDHAAFAHRQKLLDLAARLMPSILDRLPLQLDDAHPDHVEDEEHYKVAAREAVKAANALFEAVDHECDRIECERIERQGEVGQK